MENTKDESVLEGLSTSCAKIKAGAPVNFRFFKKKNGQTILQGAYPWTKGFTGGFDWEDIPVVEEE